MIKIEAVNPGEKPNDGDLIKISCSRKELNLLYQALGTHPNLDPEYYGAIFHTMALAVKPPFNMELGF